MAQAKNNAYTLTITPWDTVMLRNELHTKKAEIEAAAKKYGAKHIRIFGSVARGEENPDSDIDFLVDLPKGYDLFLQRMPLTEQLAKITGRKIDLVPEHELNVHMRDYVLQEAAEIWASLGSLWFIGGITQERGNILSDDILYDAILRNLQTLSEATQKLPETLK